jgi:aldehyde:ferredoxin oxidoreductase
MSGPGYAGEILKVDISNRKISKIPSDEYTDRYVGGRGIGARLFWEAVPPQAKAFDPENGLAFTPGPVAGFSGFAGGRWVMCGRSPAGEQFSYANLGGKWGSALKYAGFDGMLVTGQAEKPVYLFINNDVVEIRDASALWGKNALDSIYALKDEAGKDSCVLSIGPAAENLVRFATMLTDEGASGSGGLGAVMGAKKLKAVVVSGSKRPQAADPERLRLLANRVKKMRELSSTPHLPWDVPGVTKNSMCYGCGLGCYHYIYFDEKNRLCKALCQASGFYFKYVMKYYGKWNEAHLRASRLCDEYGLDTSVIQGLIELLLACCQQGLIKEEEIGLPLSKVGSAEFMERLTRMIAFREGFGSILARGTIEAADYIGPQAKAMISQFVSTRHNETKDYDPRMAMTAALLYATEPRRPIQQLHELSQLLMVWLDWLKKDKEGFFSTEDFIKAAERYWGGALAADFSTTEGKGRAAKIIQDRSYIKESMVLCDPKWPFIWSHNSEGCAGDGTLESQMLSAITGKEIDEAGLLKKGERTINLQRAILLRQGWAGRKDDRLLDYFHEVPLRKGEVYFNSDALVPGKGGEVISKVGTVVDRVDFEKMKDDYYEARGWDVQCGLPTRAKLEDLQLKDVADDLESRGLLG